MSPLNIRADQSGKIEDSRDSILAYSNSKKFAIRISLGTKQQVLAFLRKQGRSRHRAVIILFSACLFLLLQNALAKASRITIDREYVGHENDIKAMLLRYAREHNISVQPEFVVFAEIGKSSRAHEHAI